MSVCLISIQIIWSISYILSKILVQNFPPLIWVWIKSGLASVLLVSFALLSKRPHPEFSKNFFMPLALFAILGGVLTQGFFFTGLYYTTSINSAVLNSLTPLVTLLVVILFGSEKATRSQLIGLAISLVGILIFCRVEQYQFLQKTLFGDFLTILNCICYGTFLALSKKFFQTYDRVWITAWIFIFTALLIPLFAYQDMIHFTWPHMTTSLWIAASYSVIIATLLGYFLVVWVVAHHSALKISQFEYLQPVFTAILAYIFLNETLTLQSWVGGTAIFAGLALSLKGNPA